MLSAIHLRQQSVPSLRQRRHKGHYSLARTRTDLAERCLLVDCLSHERMQGHQRHLSATTHYQLLQINDLDDYQTTAVHLLAG